MPAVTRITSLTNPRIKDVVRLREHRHRRKTGLFVAEGMREVTRAAEAGLRFTEVYVCPELLGEGPAGELLEQLVNVPGRFDVPAAVFRKIAYLREPEGVLAVVEQPDWSLEKLAPPAADALYLVAVGIEKPGNLGAMVRTADAAGCAGVLAAGAPVDAFNPNAIRTSTAAVFTLPVVEVGEADAIEWLSAHNVPIIAAALDDNALAHTAADLRGPVAIAVGPEDVGLSPTWLNAASHTVMIPMQGRTVDSLNAATAAAILLFEARRQREQAR